MEWIVESESKEHLVFGCGLIGEELVRCEDCKYSYTDERTVICGYRGFFCERSVLLCRWRKTMNRKIEFIEEYIKVGDEDYKWKHTQGVLVRCKNCRFYNTTGCQTGFGWCESPIVNTGVYDEWFCADGERATDG